MMTTNTNYIENIDGQSWCCLFGVNSTDKFGYEDPFWTTKNTLNVNNPEKFTASFKYPSFYEKPINQLMIVA